MDLLHGLFHFAVFFCHVRGMSAFVDWLPWLFESCSFCSFLLHRQHVYKVHLVCLVVAGLPAFLPQCLSRGRCEVDSYVLVTDSSTLYSTSVAASPLSHRTVIGRGCHTGSLEYLGSSTRVSGGTKTSALTWHVFCFPVFLLALSHSGKAFVRR